ncbi:MAG: sugar phosphate isomerase/epimerase [Candidatus Hydrogenedentes bacterium]|nr:sugar phosphate isomerase/epimerase [Candidatus Hydrogenedentota bacterium]
MKPRLSISLLVMAPALTSLLSFANAHAGPIPKATADRLLTQSFFVFDNGVGRDQQWTIEQQAEALARFGYAGIGYSGTEHLDERLAAFKQHKLRVFNIYVPCYVDKDPTYGDDLKAAIARLKDTGVVIWLTVQGAAEDDAKAVKAVTEIADLAAASNLKVALYPHAGFFVADIEDALRVVRKVDRKNCGVTFNLCHELNAGNEARFDQLIEEAAPHLFLVSINGADHEGGWDKLIQPLGNGSFDVVRLLRKIFDVGYEGPIGLQCYQVPGDTLANLEHNMKQWRDIVAGLAGQKK